MKKLKWSEIIFLKVRLVKLRVINFQMGTAGSFPCGFVTGCSTRFSRAMAKSKYFNKIIKQK